jgi:branched-subunit amino acid ABC-type transport system permease component
VDITSLFAQFLSGLTYGTILFLVAAGLSLIFGVMNILNFAHAALWLMGAYFCYTFSAYRWQALRRLRWAGSWRSC